MLAPKIKKISSADSWGGFIFSVLSALTYFRILFRWDFVGGRSSYWQTQVQDVTQYISGLTVFRNEAWHWPLFRVNGINWPNGTTITFLDSIPIYSVIIKVFDPFFPSNPYGYWVLGCFLLQGISAWWVTRQVKDNSWLLTILVVLLCIQMPVLALRLGHLSLMSHFYIIFALGIYVRAFNTGRSSIIGWSGLVFFSFYTSVYICAMVCAIMFATAVDSAYRSKNLKSLSLYIIPLILVVLSFSATLFGTLGDAVNDGGYGFFSMNVLSPLIGGAILSFPWYQPGTMGQYEGANYLGVGSIILISLAWSFRRRLSSNKICGVSLICVCILCWIFALSNDVYIGTFHFMHWSVPSFAESFVQTFRASGRFFWLPAYTMIIFSSLAFSSLDWRLFTPIVLVIIILQVLDLTGIREDTRHLARRSPEISLNVKEWRPLLTGIETIYLYPKFTCGGVSHAGILPIQALASAERKNLTTGYIARYKPDCSNVSSEIATAGPHSAYVFVKDVIDLQAATKLVGQKATCRELDDWVFCREGVR